MNNISEINLQVRLDENKIPHQLFWKAEHGGAPDFKESKAFLLSIWDKADQEALRIDLWTKQMMVDEMNDFFFQTLVTMADTYQRATGDQELSEEMKNFGRELKKKMDDKLNQNKGV